MLSVGYLLDTIAKSETFNEETAKRETKLQILFGVCEKHWENESEITFQSQKSRPQMRKSPNAKQNRDSVWCLLEMQGKRI